MSVFTVSVKVFALYGRSNRDHKLQFKSCDTFNHRKVSHLLKKKNKTLLLEHESPNALVC